MSPSDRLAHWVRQAWKYLWSRKAYRFLIRDWQQLPDLDALARAVASSRYTRNLTPVVQDPPAMKHGLVIAPHPDDEIIGMGGTLIRALDAGVRITVVYLTSGKESESRKLEAEAEAVAKELGYQTVFLRQPLLNIPLDRRTLEVVGGVFAEREPDVCFLPFLSDDHDDHRRASHLIWAARQAGVLTRSFEVWAYQVYSSLIPNVVVDITEVSDRKAAAIRAWRSQLARRDWAHIALGLNAYNVRYLSTADPRYAETCFVLPVEQYTRICSVYFGSKCGHVYSSETYRSDRATSDEIESVRP